MFERSLRRYAKEVKDYHLTSALMEDNSTGERFYVQDEKEVFDLLGIDYLAPEDRNC